jgi:septal ring factor EnvC (AmiA/AmiB activator)
MSQKLDKQDIKELIDTLELYLTLIKDDLPQLQEESKKISTILSELKTENRKITNIGNILIEIRDMFKDIKKEISKNSNQTKEIEHLYYEYKSFKNRLIVAYTLIGFIVGYLINYFLPI